MWTLSDELVNKLGYIPITQITSLLVLDVFCAGLISCPLQKVCQSWCKLSNHLLVKNKTRLQIFRYRISKRIYQMAFAASAGHGLLVGVLLYIFVCGCKFGRAYDYPHLGAAGVVANEYLPKAEGEGETDQYFPQAGIIGINPARIFSKALGCLKDNYIYSSCEEDHRLSEKGELHVPPEYTDDYCKGPCVEETKHVLDCIDGILKGFVFLNRATLEDVRDTIEGGCGYGPKRGNFNVLEHVQANAAGKKVLNAAYVVAIALWRVLM